MLAFLVAAAIDVFVALALSGCIYGLARAMDRRPSFPRIVAWTAFAMFAIATRGELKIAESGLARPDVGQVIPLLILTVVMYRLGWRGGSGEPDPEVAAAVAAEFETVEAELAG
jgi:hypothetical protein